MRKSILFNENWDFIKTNETLDNAAVVPGIHITLPHTWNSKDGQAAGSIAHGFSRNL